MGNIPAIPGRRAGLCRVFYIDIPGAGPRAAQRLEAAGHRFARFDRTWHERARRDNPDWPALP
jgi:hypothetical protein